jgi:hypothetical protein
MVIRVHFIAVDCYTKIKRYCYLSANGLSLSLYRGDLSLRDYPLDLFRI